MLEYILNQYLHRIARYEKIKVPFRDFCRNAEAACKPDPLQIDIFFGKSQFRLQGILHFLAALQHVAIHIREFEDICSTNEDKINEIVDAINKAIAGQ